MLLATTLTSGPFIAVALAMFGLVVYMLTVLALAERAHKRRRRFMGLPDQPTDFSLYVQGITQQRIRTEARLGISPKPRRR